MTVRIIDIKGLLRCRYGRTITQEEIYRYVVDHCVHLGTPGTNPEYGYGIPVLGDPGEEYFGGGKGVKHFQSLPIDGPLRVTSSYGKRSTGIAGASSWHRGIDLGGVRNRAETKVLSVLPGKVKANYWNDYRGNVIVIDHGGGIRRRGALVTVSGRWRIRSRSSLLGQMKEESEKALRRLF